MMKVCIKLRMNYPPEADFPASTDSVTGSSALASLPSSIDSTSRDQVNTFTEALNGVLDLHTSRRMKPPSSSSESQKQGVSIPSQRRFLYYWALCLANEAPAGFWSLHSIAPAPSISSFEANPPKHVRMTEIKIRFRELSNAKAGLLKAANFVIEKGTSKVKINVGSNQVWASLARYDDEFISRLEKWEKYSRDENGRLGVRRPGSEHMNSQGERGEEERLAAMFSDGRWDRQKMIRCFDRLGETGGATGRVQAQEDDMVSQCLLLLGCLLTMRCIGRENIYIHTSLSDQQVMGGYTKEYHGHLIERKNTTK